MTKLSKIEPTKVPRIIIHAIRESSTPFHQAIREKQWMKALKIVEDTTKLRIHDIGNTNREDELAVVLAGLFENGKNLPKDIKHVVIGHGEGVLGKDWKFRETGTSVTDYVNTLPKGDKALLLTCQTGRKVGFDFFLNTSRTNPPLILTSGSKVIKELAI